MCYTGSQPVTVPQSLDLEAPWGSSVHWIFRRYGAGFFQARRLIARNLEVDQVKKVVISDDPAEGFDLVVMFTADMVQGLRRVRVEASVAIHVAPDGFVDFNPHKVGETGRISVWGATDTVDSTQFELRTAEFNALKTRIINAILVYYLLDRAS